MSGDSRDILTRPPLAADHRLGYGEGPLSFGDLRLPDGPGKLPLAIVIHGGSWSNRHGLDHIGHLCAALTARGLATWSLEFRRVGDPGGGWPGTFQDVAQGTDHIRHLATQYPLDLDRVIAVGHSSGGHLALWTAARHRVPSELVVSNDSPRIAAVVSLAGILGLRSRWAAGERPRMALEGLLGGPPDQFPDRYAATSPDQLLPLGVRQLLIHGRIDDGVPISGSEAYVALARAAGDDAELLPIDEAGHFELIDPMSAQWPQVEDAIVGAVPAGHR